MRSPAKPTKFVLSVFSSFLKFSLFVRVFLFFHWFFSFPPFSSFRASVSSFLEFSRALSGFLKFVQVSKILVFLNFLCFLEAAGSSFLGFLEFARFLKFSRVAPFFLSFVAVLVPRPSPRFSRASGFEFSRVSWVFSVFSSSCPSFLEFSEVCSVSFLVPARPSRRQLSSEKIQDARRLDEHSRM